MQTRLALFGVALSLATVGCGGRVGQDEQYFTLTTVHGTNSDGTPTVETRTISLSEEIALRDAFTGASASGDVAETTEALHGLTASFGCDSRWFWMFDQPHQVGNDICFRSYDDGTGDKFGYADLSQYCLEGGSGGCSASRWSRTRSYWNPYNVTNGNGYFQDPAGNQEWFNCVLYGRGAGYGCGTHEATGAALNSRYIFLDPANG